MSYDPVVEKTIFYERTSPTFALGIMEEMGCLSFQPEVVGLVVYLTLVISSLGGLGRSWALCGQKLSCLSAGDEADATCPEYLSRNPIWEVNS